MRQVKTVMTLLVLSACGGDPKSVAQQELEGTWLAPCLANPPDMNGQVSYAQAQFTYLPSGQGAFQYSLYGDPSCTSRLAVFLIESDITLGNELPALAKGTWEMNVKYRKLSATPYVEGFVQGFTGARCGTGAWQIGATQDISNTGCFTFKPLSQCGADYDVARVDADHFSNGARDADMCTPAGRPTRLADFSFNRVKA